MGLLDTSYSTVNSKKPRNSDRIQPGQEMNIRGLLDAATNIPVVGDALSGGMAIYDAAKGDYGSAAVNALGVLPFVSGTLTRKGSKAVGALDGFEPSSPSGKGRRSANSPDSPSVRTSGGQNEIKLQNRLESNQADALVTEHQRKLPMAGAANASGIAANHSAINPLGSLNITQFDRAHEEARKNAVKILGLPESNTAMDRAKAMGFDTPVYHGTANDFKEFDVSRLGTNTRQDGGELGFFSSAKPDLASQYAEIAANGGWAGRTNPESAVVYPLLARLENPKQYETASGFYRDADMKKANGGFDAWRNEIQAQGHDGVFVRPDREEVVTFAPNQLRSRFAAFDPMRRHEADLLGYADPYLLGTIGGAGLLGSAAYKYGQDK